MSEEKVTPLASIMDQEVRATGADIPDGSYGATLFGFSEPQWMATSKEFLKPGMPEKRQVFDARFGMYDKTGGLTEITYLCPVPDGGKANRKSNFYKMLKSLAAGKVEIMDAEGNMGKGVTLKNFLGLNAVLNVQKNKKDWPAVAGISPRMDGIKYPTLDECKQLRGSEDVPF